MAGEPNSNITKYDNKVFDSQKHLNNFWHNRKDMKKANIGLTIFELIECKDKPKMFQQSNFSIIFTRQ